MNIGGNLRISSGMTQAELAEKVKVTVPMISQIERGTKILTIPLGLEITKVLNCSIDDLIK